MHLRRFPIIALVAVALVASGCSSSGGGKDDEPVPVDRQEGRQLFQQTCRVCHSLADATAAGTFGPDLDQLQPDEERVRQQIEEGSGGMPSKLLEGEQAETVAKYVAEVAGNGPDAPAPDGGAGAPDSGADEPEPDATPDDVAK